MPLSSPNLPILFSRFAVFILDYYDVPIFPVFLLSLFDIGIGKGGSYVGVDFSAELSSSSHSSRPKYRRLLPLHQ